MKKAKLKNFTITAENNDGASIQLTAAEILRRRRQQQRQQNEQQSLLVSSNSSTQTNGNTDTSAPFSSSIDNIDDEIQRLERELEGIDDDDEDDTNDSDDDVDNGTDHYDDNNSKNIINNNNNREEMMIFSLSESKLNPIEKLPTHCLPPIPTTGSTNNKSKSGSKKKRSRKDGDDDNDNNDKTKLGTTAAIHGSGLKQAVHEFIHNYQGRASTERIPYHCRYCHYQAHDHTDFTHHQTTPIHEQNVLVHNKASYCKLCHKQFNSPIQLKEHLSSKPHSDKLRYLQSKQQQPKSNNKARYMNTAVTTHEAVNTKAAKK